MTYPQAIVKEFETVVSRVNTEILTELQANNPDAGITGIRYDYGHWVEVQENLKQLDESTNVDKKKSKYPLIILLEDIPIQHGTTNYYGIATLSILICTSTQQQYKSRDRQQKNFDPLLEPIYHELLRQISMSTMFVESHESNIEHQRIDRKFLGRLAIGGNTANRITDYIDAIELNNMRLTLLNSNCLMPINQS